MGDATGEPDRLVREDEALRGRVTALQAEQTTEAMPVETLEVAETAVELQETVESPVAGFPVVGIGASAGGLKAFEAFFSGMPADQNPGMAFVLVQHLAPDHESILASIVQRYTHLSVFEVEDGMGIRCTERVFRSASGDGRLASWKRQLVQREGACSCGAGGIVRGPTSLASSTGSSRARVVAQYLGASSR